MSSIKGTSSWHTPRWYKKHPEAQRHNGSKAEPTTTKQPPTVWNWLSRAWNWLSRARRWGSALVVGISVLLAYLVFRADVNFTPQTRLDPNDPFSTLFTVTNENAFDIENVRFACHMNYVEVSNYRIASRDQDGSINLGDTNLKEVPEIGSHQGQDAICEFGVAGVPVRIPPNGPPLVYNVADITLCASFRPHFWWRRKQWQRFVGLTDGHGNIVGVEPSSWWNKLCRYDLVVEVSDSPIQVRLPWQPRAKAFRR